jgi:hypothetical protein
MNRVALFAMLPGDDRKRVGSGNKFRPSAQACARSYSLPIRHTTQRANHAGTHSGKQRQRRRGRGKLPHDPRDVETNASIAQHRKQVKEDAANAEMSKDRHGPIVEPGDGAMVSKKSAIVTAVIIFDTDQAEISVSAPPADRRETRGLRPAAGSHVRTHTALNAVERSHA